MSTAKIKDLVSIKRFYAIPLVDFGKKPDCLGIAEKRDSLSHYTDVEALLTILSEKKFKASRLDYLDDLQEKSFIQDMIDQNETLPYVVSFDHSQSENIALWCMYTKNDTGVRVTFYADKQYSRHLFGSLFKEGVSIEAYRKGQNMPIIFSSFRGSEGEFLYPSVYVHTKISDVLYDEKICKGKTPLPAGDIKDWLTYAAIKAEEWKFQNETRVVADFESLNSGPGREELIPRFDYLKLPIGFEMLEKIVITFSPWMGIQMKEAIKGRISTMELGIDRWRIEFEDSKFTGLISRK